jgi:hypothetical protein
MAHHPWRITLLVSAGVGLSWLTTFATDIVFRRFIEAVPQQTMALSMVSAIISLVLSTFFTLGTNRALLAAVRGQTARVGDLFSAGDLVFGGVLATLVATAAALLGFVLLIIPGIVAVVGLSFTHLLIADGRAFGIDAVVKSFEATRGFRGRLFALMLLESVLMIGGFLMLGVGALAAYTIGNLAVAHAYLYCIGEEPEAVG